MWISDLFTKLSSQPLLMKLNQQLISFCYGLDEYPSESHRLEARMALLESVLDPSVMV